MRIILGGIVGGVILFVWGFIMWVVVYPMLLPVQPVTDSNALLGAMQANVSETGVYMLPPMPVPDPDADAATVTQMTEAWVEQHKAGPVGMMIYHAEGFDPADPMTLVRGYGINFLAALFASILLFAAARRRSYAGRVVFLLGIGLVISAYSHLVSWNFMYAPTDFTVFRIADTVGGWFVAGLVIAAIVKRPERSEPVYI